MNSAAWPIGSGSEKDFLWQDFDDDMLPCQDAQKGLRIALIGIILESKSMLHASSEGKPVIHF